VFVGYGGLAAYQSRERSGRKRWLTAVGGGLAVIGGLGFLGAAFSAAGGLRWLPPDFEWPIGFANGALTTLDGKHVVPHTASGRIQVYDPDWKFVTGWFVNAGGGKFKIGLKGRNYIEVITARREMRYLFTIHGYLLVSETYKPLTYSDFTTSGKSVVVPTHWWLWPFTTPFFSWFIAAVGMALIMLSDPSKKKQKIFVSRSTSDS
jgi:hypothetical protein